ncbi:MAG TPA: SCO family protein [Vicinamibacterales bacterium]|nr:SCO family protein [Vicinamibacterales bacterium]
MRPPALLIALLLAAGCSRTETRQYPIRGQILGIGTTRPDGRTEVTIKNDDIPGFMPAMTMPYTVKDRGLLAGVGPGDLFVGKLVLEGNDAYLSAIAKTGHAPLPADARAVPIPDVMQPGDLVPDDPLEDQEGTTRRLSDWRGRALAVTFVYTRCPLPDFCPLLDRQFGALQKAVKEDPALHDRVHLASITFDPSHDTPAIIRAHASARGADPAIWSYLTGSPAAIGHVTSRFGVSTIFEKDAPQTITHNLRTAIVDRHGRLVTIYSGNDWTPDALLKDLRDAYGR